MFEAKCVFPRDSKLTLSVYDYDMVSANDLIGTTVIDLEARWLSLYTVARCRGVQGRRRWLTCARQGRAVGQSALPLRCGLAAVP